MKKRHLIFIGIVVLVALIFIPALYYLGDNVTKATAGLALFISVGKTLYDINEKEAEKEKKKEVMTATVKYGCWDTTGNDLGVRIYNAGSTPIHIESVWLVNPLTKENHFQFDNLDYKSTEHLEPKHVAKFRHSSSGKGLEFYVTTMKPSEYAIEIRTFGGTTHRVSGEEIDKAMKNPAPRPEVF